MNTFLGNIENWRLMYGESYQEIVEMHDDLFGSAFNLLEAVNATMTAAKQSGGATTIENLTEATKEARGGYQLILHDSNVSQDDGPYWKFEYDWDDTAKECKNNARK